MTTLMVTQDQERHNLRQRVTALSASLIAELFADDLPVPDRLEWSEQDFYELARSLGCAANRLLAMDGAR